jgi:ankyrin repeat protein
VRALLVAGASPDSRDRHGNTALHLASDQGLTKCVHALLQPVTVEETSNSGLVFTVPRYISKPALLEELNYDGEYPLSDSALYSGQSARSDVESGPASMPIS